MLKLIPQYKQGNKSPDHDPTHPYHYHTSDGKKVVVTPEDWEKYKDDPTFREIRAAIEAEQSAYPLPEYSDEYNNYINNLATEVENQRGYNGGTNNSLISESYGKQLPKGYSRTERGLIIGPDGKPLVAGKFRNSPKYTADFNNPTLLTFNKGLGTERNINYYPINVNVPIYKQPLPVDRVMNVGNEKAIAVDNYINNNRVVENSIIPTYNIGYVTKEEVLEPDWHINGNSYNTKKQKMPYLYAMGNPNKPVVSVLEEDENIINNFFKELYNNRNYVRNEGKYPDITKEQALILLKKLNFDNIIDVEKFRLPSKWDIATSTKRNPSRQEAEKKAVISVGPLERVKTFANGGKLKLISKNI